MVSYLVGERSITDGTLFMRDVASRLANRVQLTTDGNRLYLMAVDDAFGGDVDYAQLLKEYGVEASDSESPTARRYSPNVVTSVETRIITGDPDRERISTSYIERSNLTMRMGMRRFTRLTNAFSKKVENHAAAVALHYLHCNFARPHKSLANPIRVPRRWPQGSRITSGRARKSPRCWTNRVLCTAPPQKEHAMLDKSPFFANIPVTDLARARAFYEGMLGLRPWRVDDRIHEVVYEAGTTRFAVYQSSGAGKAEHTIGTFVVEDLDAVVAWLRSRGVELVDYDLPGLKTEDGIATLGFDRVAWFRDPDGNLLNLTQQGPGGRNDSN